MVTKSFAMSSTVSTTVCCRWRRVGIRIDSRKPNTQLPNLKKIGDKVVKINVLLSIEVKRQLLVISEES
jgi:hypothetical protein